MTDVVAALIWDNDRFLACQRPATKARALLWEFVGGKVEPGESREEALVRECREELGITVKPLDIFMEVTHEYPDLTVHLILYNAKIAEGTIQLLEHNRYHSGCIKISAQKYLQYMPIRRFLQSKTMKNAAVSVFV